MGSPISPTLANIVMEDFDESILRTIPYHIPFCKRYMDDYIMAVPMDSFNDIFERFNKHNNNLTFTLEKSDTNNNHKINFLDTTLTIENNRIIHNWYQKPTWSGRYIYFLSEHDISHKKSVITALVDRAILLSNQLFHKKTSN